MLAIEIELLAGRYVATRASERSRVEWPPEPARFFSALVAGLGHESRRDPSERDAVLCLETAGPPEIYASNLDPDDQSGRRTVNTVFVPVNDSAVAATDRVASAYAALATATLRDRQRYEQTIDRGLAPIQDPPKAALDEALHMLPAGRPRQARFFPSITPAVPRLWFVWPDLTVEPRLGTALGRVLERLTALGHSSSLVRCALVAGPPPGLDGVGHLVPSRRGQRTLRCVGPGQLARLDTEYERHRGVAPRVLPFVPQAYALATAPGEGEAPTSVFEADGWIVVECQPGRRAGRLSLTRGVDLAKALHGALASHATPQPALEIVTGRVDGGPSPRPHLALLPLPDVDHENAHGGLLGVALVFPRAATEAERLHVIDALLAFEARGTPLRLARGTECPVQRVDLPSARTLQETTWTRSSRQWVTVTPIALDRNPGDLRTPAAMRAAVQIVSDACTHIGLPRPSRVELSLTPYVHGSSHVRDFAPFPREAERLRRVRVHALLEFERAIRGPVVLGAGRYFGLGLCRPAGRG